MSDDEPSGTLDPGRYDRWFEQPWGRHAFKVERDALLDALGPLDGRQILELGCGTGRADGRGHADPEHHYPGEFPWSLWARGDLNPHVLTDTRT